MANEFCGTADTLIIKDQRVNRNSVNVLEKKGTESCEFSGEPIGYGGKVNVNNPLRARTLTVLSPRYRHEHLPLHTHKCSASFAFSMLPHPPDTFPKNTIQHSTTCEEFEDDNSNFPFFFFFVNITYSPSFS